MNVHILYTFFLLYMVHQPYVRFTQQTTFQTKQKQTHALQHMNDGGIICAGGS